VRRGRGDKSGRRTNDDFRRANFCRTLDILLGSRLCWGDTGEGHCLGRRGIYPRFALVLGFGDSVARQNCSHWGVFMVWSARGPDVEGGSGKASEGFVLQWGVRANSSREPSRRGGGGIG